MSTENKVEFRQVKNQYFSAVSANLLIVGFGCSIGWFSPALPLLQSTDSPLASGPLTVEQISWAGSLPSLGGLLANFVFGYLVTKLGAKKTITILVVPQLSAWLLLIFGRTVECIYVSRFVGGIVVGGAQIAIALYIAEIADNRIRGILGTIFQFSRNFGILFAYSLGAYFTYITSSMFFIGVSTLFFMSFVFLPATPQHLLHMENEKKAQKAYKFYHAYPNDNESQKHSADFERLKTIAKEVKDDASVTLKDLFEPAARKGFLISFFFCSLNQLSGSYTILTYGSNIIKQSGTDLSPNLSAILLAAVQMLGTFLTSQLVDTKGRRFLLLLSLSGCTFGLSSLAIFLFLDSMGYRIEMFSWFPVVLLAFVVFIASIGIVPLTMICLVEFFPIKVRPIGLTWANVVFSLFSFTMTKFFPIFVEVIQLHGCLAILAVCCALGILFTIFVVNETKGKELNVLNEENETHPKSASK